MDTGLPSTGWVAAFGRSETVGRALVGTDAAALALISQLVVHLFLTPLFQSLEPYQPVAEGTALLRLTLGDLGHTQQPWFSHL